MVVPTKMGRALVGCAWILGVFVACSSSSDKGGTNAPPREWGCSESTGDLSCTCYGYEPGNNLVIVNGRKVYACESFNCCFQSVDSSTSTPKCDCENSDTCDAEIAGHEGAARVASCPPPGSVHRDKCAAVGESCSPSDLVTNDLIGCCPGSICQLDAVTSVGACVATSQ